MTVPSRLLWILPCFLSILGACTQSIAEPSTPAAVMPALGPVSTADDLAPATAPATSPSMQSADAEMTRLQEAIAAYRAIATAGGWPIIPAGASLRPGTSDARIAALRARLRITGDMAAKDAMPEEAAPQVFDPALAAAVRRFQTRHGLEVDGIVGRETLAALNIPLAARLATLGTNLARLQRERRQWGDRFIVVNTAAAQYRLVDGAVVIFDRPVIVGRADWPTPRLEGVIRELELHPAWVVPPNIARREILPRIRNDPNYLSKHNMRIVDGMIRQAPGPGNPLGKVKFIFPNDDSIYLHDTNNPGLFARAARHLSHGCVRVSNAVELARYLLRDDPAWPNARLDAHLASGGTERITLRQPIPVHLVYDTAWVDADGTVQFRADVYRRDLASQHATVATAGACPDWRG